MWACEGRWSDESGTRSSGGNRLDQLCISQRPSCALVFDDRALSLYHRYCGRRLYCILALPCFSYQIIEAGFQVCPGFCAGVSRLCHRASSEPSRSSGAGDEHDAHPEPDFGHGRIWLYLFRLCGCPDSRNSVYLPADPGRPEKEGARRHETALWHPDHGQR